MPWVSFAQPALRLTFLPSLPATGPDVDAPALFRRRFVLSGYRPVGVSWRCCVLSLFQIHNETVNVWSHLLGAVSMAIRFTMFTILQGGGILGFRLQGPEGQGFSVDASSLPLVLYAVSAVSYLSCSAAAHLLQSHSERVHLPLFLLESVGVAVHQYGSALALFLYSSNSAWTQSMLGQVFLAAAAALCCFSCAACCFAKFNFTLRRKLCQGLLMGVAYLLGILPITHRLATCSWINTSTLTLHILQVMLYFLSSFFFSCPVPERFSPGTFDLLGSSHQLSHVLQSVCSLAQQEALLHDFLWRRPAMIREYGERRLLLAGVSFLCVTICCALTAFATRRRPPAPVVKEQE